MFPENIENAENAFQSHFGLILSLRVLTTQSHTNSPFNPILVWFYHPWVRRETEGVIFQSHFGLILSARTDWCTEAGENSFQSHFGLILSSTVVRIALNKYITFNPILVWFYLVLSAAVRTDVHLSIPFWSDFIYVSG